MQHSPTGPYERRRQRATIALIESDWLDVKMWSWSRCLGLKLRWSRGSRCRGVEMFGSGQVFAGDGRVEVTIRKGREC